MSLLFCDGFDHYATAQIPTKWSQQGTSANWPSISSSGGRFGGGYLETGWTGYVRTTLTSRATWIIGVAAFFNRLEGLGSGWALISLLDSGTVHVYVRFDAARHLQVVRGDGTVLGTGSTVVAVESWNYIEMKATIHDSAGVVVVRLNGVVELNLTSQDTRNGGNSTADAFQLGSQTSGDCYFDDVYACDDSGSANNDLLGDIRVVALAPTGAGNYSQFTPSTGSNYQNVDDATPDGDTTYNSDGTVGHIDTYAFSDISQTGTIKAIQHLVYASKDDAGARSIAPVQRSGSTDYVGTTAVLASHYAYVREVVELNPATSAAFTIAEVNAAEFGVTVVS